MLKFLFTFFVTLVSVECQTWASRACLVNHNEYYAKIMQNVVNRIEKDIRWCNFKLIDVNQEINEHLFKWHAQGTANYTNGFLLSFRNIDVSNIRTQFSSRTVNDTSVNLLSANGLLNFRNLNIGYDVVANIEDLGTHHFTGIFSYTAVAIQCTIVKNLRTNEISVTTMMASSTPNSRRMEYTPQNSISEMLSRHYAAYLTSPSFSRWGQDHIAPLILDVTSKTELPEIRFDNKC